MGTETLETMTPNEVAALLRINRSTLHRLIRAGDGPKCVWITEHTARFLRSDVEAFLRGRNG